MPQILVLQNLIFANHLLIGQYSLHHQAGVRYLSLVKVSLLAEYYKKLILLVIKVLFKVIWKSKEREWISATLLPKLQEKVWERGKISDVMEEGEKLNFDNEIIEILAA